MPGIPAAQARGLVNAATLGGLPSNVPAPVLAAARQGVFAGLNEILLVAGIVAAAGAVAALVLVRTRDFMFRQEQAAEAATLIGAVAD
jgi:hypothetical protein